ncbi:MAG: RsmB/NOP family class I SAM-dependent RNA methyltransferase, partial [Lachnospiraceae bacterium]
MIALPVGFQKRMSDLLGDKAPAFFATYDRERSHALRVNTLKADPDRIRQLLPYLRDPVPWAPEGYYYEETEVDGTEHRPGKNPLHEAGCYYIQEASAMAVAALSGVQPGERVLDLCAAPGGKSTQLAAGMQGEGLLVSNEISPQRAKILSQNIERCGIINAIVTNMDTASLAEALPAYFDRVVVDAPCSGEGMFKKEQAALDMWSEDNIRLCHERQLEILENAAKLLRPGGTLVYSTCTFAPEEDEETLAAF